MGRWERLASRLGLTRLTRRRVLGTHRLVGERNGRLVAIWASHSLSASSVDLLVRYPQRSTVRGMRESMLTDSELASAFGRKRSVPRSKRKDLFVGDGSVVMRLRWAVFPPSNSRIEKVLDALIGAVGRESRELDRVCEGCEQDRSPSVFLIDGFPGYFCQSCVDQHMEGDSARAEWMKSVEGDVETGATLGAVSALAFGLFLGAIASIAVSKIGEPVLVNPAAILVFVCTALLGYLVTVFTQRGLQDFSIWSGMLAFPFVLLGTLVLSTSMWLVARQTLRPAPYTIGLLLYSIWNEGVARPGLSLSMAGAAIAGWLVALLIRGIWLIRQRRSSKVEAVA
jgi:hypothetical protein